jgi:hypothetical protein
MELTQADIAYVCANFRPLDDVCREHGESPEQVRELIRARRLPAPSYVLPDGTEMVPADYFALMDEAGGADRLRDDFDRRHRRAGGDPAELDEDWDGYIDGIYAICLRSVSPETIVRKTELVDAIGALLEQPAQDDAEWRSRLRRQVDELDALERDFSPDYDRHQFGRPPTRDLLINAARERYPDVFAAAASRVG